MADISSHSKVLHQGADARLYVIGVCEPTGPTLAMMFFSAKKTDESSLHYSD